MYMETGISRALTNGSRRWTPRLMSTSSGNNRLRRNSVSSGKLITKNLELEQSEFQIQTENALNSRVVSWSQRHAQIWIIQNSTLESKT